MRRLKRIIVTASAATIGVLGIFLLDLYIRMGPVDQRRMISVKRNGWHIMDRLQEINAAMIIEGEGSLWPLIETFSSSTDFFNYCLDKGFIDDASVFIYNPRRISIPLRAKDNVWCIVTGVDDSDLKSPFLFTRNLIPNDRENEQSLQNIRRIERPLGTGPWAIILRFGGGSMYRYDSQIERVFNGAAEGLTYLAP